MTGVETVLDLPAEAFASALASLPGMGPARLAAVLGAVSPAAAWARVRRGEAWREPAVIAALGRHGPRVVAGWRAAAAAIDVEHAWQRVGEERVVVALRGGEGYPELLVDDVEPPALLFRRGPLDVVAEHPRVAVVGTRTCTATGARVAFELGRDLSDAGVSIVSGLALGIDAAAHRGALASGVSPLVGVVGSGLDVIYPPTQGPLWHAVAQAGVLLSEAPLGVRPERWRFPARNRIIAGLADLVVVVESHRRGGSLHTVDEADRRAIDVMAVPGSVRNSAAAGANDLLAEGRAPVRDADDVLVALGLTTSRRGRREPEPGPDPASLAPADRWVLDALAGEPASLDELASRTDVDIPQLAASLERLCEAGWVTQDGGWYEMVTP